MLGQSGQTSQRRAERQTFGLDADAERPRISFSVRSRSFARVAWLFPSTHA